MEQTSPRREGKLLLSDLNHLALGCPDRHASPDQDQCLALLDRGSEHIQRAGHELNPQDSECPMLPQHAIGFDGRRSRVSVRKLVTTPEMALV